MAVTYEIRLQNVGLSFDEDISADVQKISWNRGRNSELDKAAAGALYVTVNNHDKKYSPENTGSPFYPYLMPKKLLLSVKATKNSTVYWQFKGRLEDVTPTFTPRRKTAVLTAWDGLDELEKTTVRPELKEGQKFGVLVGHVADEAGWFDTLRDIDTGKDEVALWGPAEASAREDLKELEETEDGFVYIDHEGKLAAEDRDHRVGATSQATFDNNMRQPRYRLGADTVLNEITCPVVPRWIEEKESDVWTLIDIAGEDTPPIDPPIIPAGEEKTFRANLEGMAKALQSPQPKLDYDAHANKEGTGGSLLEASYNWLYVTANGDVTETGAIFGQIPDSGAHWDKLSDTSEAKYLYAAQANCSSGWYDRHWCWGAELFQIGNLPGGVTRVSKLAITAKVKTELQAGFGQLASPIQIWIKTGGNIFKKEVGKATTAWGNLTATWEVNPNTGLPWTPTEVNALQIGIRLRRQTYDTIGYTQYEKCCALYAKVSTNPLEVTSWSAKAQTADFTIKNWGGTDAHMTLLKLRGNKVIEEDELTAIKPDAPSQSQTDYKKRTHDIQTRWISDLPTAENLCTVKLARHEAPRPEIAITLVNRNATLWEQMLKLHISDVVTVICDKLGITTPGKTYFIEHMEHTVIRPGAIHRCTYILSDATGIAASTGKTPPAITDTTPPAMPTTFAVKPAYKALNLTWDANTEPDFDYYEIWANDDGNLAEAKLLQVVRDNHWGDPIGISDTGRCYWIRAVDTHGNKSALSTAAFETTLSELLDDLAVPGDPTGLVATGYLGGILLTWNSNTESDFDYYEIYRHTSNDSGAASLIAIARATSYVDPVGTGVLRYYWLKAVDRLGYTSGFSSGASATSLMLASSDEAKGLQAYVADTAFSSTGYNNLTWAAGAIHFADTTSQSIDAGFLTLTATHYFYFVVGNTTLQNTTTFADTVGDDKGLVAIAKKSSVTALKAFFLVPFGRDILINRDVVVAGLVSELQLADDAVTHAKVAVNAIYGDIIKAAAITGPKISGLAVSEAKIAANAITAVKINTGAVEEAKLAAAAVTVTKIADNAVTSPKIIAGAVVAGKIAAGAVETNKLDALAVTADKIAANAVTAVKILALNVQAGHIAAGAVETEKLAALAVDAGKIAAGAIEAEKIAAGAVIAGKIAANAVTATTIEANAVTAVKIQANAVTAGKINAGAVTTVKLDALAVSADKIAANAVTADKISVATLDAISANVGELTAGTITGLLIRTAASGDRVEISTNKLQAIKAGVVAVEIHGTNGFMMRGTACFTIKNSAGTIVGYLQGTTNEVRVTNATGKGVGIYAGSYGVYITASGSPGIVELNADGDIRLTPGSTKDIRLGLGAGKAIWPIINGQGQVGYSSYRFNYVYCRYLDASISVRTPLVQSSGGQALVLEAGDNYVLPPSHNTDDFGSPTRKWYRICRTNVDGCPIPTSNSAIAVFKKLRAPRVTTGEHGYRHYFKDADFPDEMKYINREGDFVIEQVRTLGVTVQAVRELVERVEALEAG